MANHGLLFKCQRCYALELEVPLMLCSQCKMIRYCSKECQKADWKMHKVQCESHALLERSLKEDENTFQGTLRRLFLPDGMSLYELDKRLEEWVRFHQHTLMVACMHAIRLPEDYDRIHTHVLCLRLRPRPRAEHGGAPGKYFAVIEAYALAIDEGAKRNEPWEQNVEHLKNIQKQAERLGAGRTGATVLECDPLAVQTAPFGSVPRVRGRVEENWKDILMRDVDNGNAFTSLSLMQY